jgi:hypothetical protein
MGLGDDGWGGGGEGGGKVVEGKEEIPGSCTDVGYAEIVEVGGDDGVEEIAGYLGPPEVVVVEAIRVLVSSCRYVKVWIGRD